MQHEAAAFDRQAVIMAAVTGLTRAMDIRGMRKGSVLIPDSWDAADLTFLSSDVDDEESKLRNLKNLDDVNSEETPGYAPVRTAAATAPLLRVLNIPAAGPCWMPLPAALFEGHAFIKARSTKTSDETVIDQGAVALTFRFSS